MSQSAESDTSAKQKQGCARVGTCLEVPLLARLGRKVLEPNFGNMGPPEVKREKVPPAQNLCSRVWNNDSEGGKAILPSRGINFCRLEFAGMSVYGDCVSLFYTGYMFFLWFFCLITGCVSLSLL